MVGNVTFRPLCHPEAQEAPEPLKDGTVLKRSLQLPGIQAWSLH
jgi:hypothetical protein